MISKLMLYTPVRVFFKVDEHAVVLTRQTHLRGAQQKDRRQQSQITAVKILAGYKERLAPGARGQALA